ncbi:MAG: chorismate-binding protein [Bacteroidota bacterium]
MESGIATQAVKQKIKISVNVRRYLADTTTPVSLYLKMRDYFGSSVLLESSDFNSMENCRSFIGFEAIANFVVQDYQLQYRFPDGAIQQAALKNSQQVPELLNDFIQQFEVEQHPNYQGVNGLFGHTSFDAYQYFDTLKFDREKRKMDLPDVNYSLYRYVIAINHFKDEMTVIENLPEGETSGLDQIESLLKSQRLGQHRFQLVGEEQSNLSDEEFKKLVTIGKQHCQIGDVFQIVFARQFSQQFQGDDFNVYRVLRSINPSPYLFYFDYGSYKIFGSSPEAQMVLNDGIAGVNPIAGTYRRSGDDAEDRKQAVALSEDPKENAEHIMLVDLARNDLGKHCQEVEVKKLKEIQFFSHVIHLVSTVEGRLTPGLNPIRVFGDTFPAGTLSGAPKYKAMELIDKYENQNRGFYGGGIGYIGFNGDMNQAIVIRSFLSKDNTLFYQAGAGVVSASVEEKELQEVNNKLGALTKALKEAEKIGL